MTLRWYAEGDSITLGSFDSVGGYPGSFISTNDLSEHPIVKVNNAISGSKLSDLTARAAALDAVLPAILGGDKWLLSIDIGVNDWSNSASTAAHLTDLTTYIDARRSAGWDYIILCTHTPYPSAGTVAGTTFDQWRTTVAATYATWVGGRVDALADFRTDSTMGPNAAASDTLLYVDGLHPTDLGSANLAAVIAPLLYSFAPTGLTGVFQPNVFQGGGVFQVDATAPAQPTHRAQYSGIRLAKLKKKRAQLALVAKEPQRITGRAILPALPIVFQVQARGTVYIPGRAVLTPLPACGCLYAQATTIIPGAARFALPITYRLTAVGTVRTDEEEVLDALAELLRQMRNGGRLNG